MKKTDREYKEIHSHDSETPDEFLTDEMLNARIGQMEKEYKDIKIPDALRGKVEQTMKKTFTEQDADRRPEKKRMVYRILMRTGQTAAAALLVITVLANTSATTAYAMSQIPVIGAITKVVTFRTYETNDGNNEAKVEVPKVEVDKNSGISKAADQVNKSVEDYTNEIISRFEKEVASEGGEGHRGLYTDYKVLADNKMFFTLKIETDEIMASGAQSVRIYNIDKKTDRILELKDLFPSGTDYVTALSDSVKETMRQNMKQDENKIYFLDDGTDSDFKTIKENQNFYINEAGHLILVFDEYEVAPGYMGLVEIEIPGNIYQAEGM